jgi:beta-glucosidase
MKFPYGFHFGASTSAYQIEGAVAEDGRQPSIWDAFAHQSGRIKDGSNGDIACDHYHRWESDVALIKSLGHNAYRFSIAWPRVVPQGRGAVNATGLDFYDRLVDRLLESGIAPYATLYHWDLPLALHAKGGWLNRDTCHAFADYAAVVAQRLGDRVYGYATLNEPRCSATVGYLEGRHAPGETDQAKALQAAHHLMLAHGLGMQALRANTRTARLGVVLDVKPYHAADDSAASRQAAHNAYGVFNRWFMDPMFLGHYPQDIWDGYGVAVPTVHAGDLGTICQPIDSLGINYYSRGHVEYSAAKSFPHAAEVRCPSSSFSDMGWEIWPDGLREMLVRIHHDYKVPDLYVAENGAAMDDVLENSQVYDPVRRDYLQSHIAAVAEAREAGVPISAYLAWSLLDNYEWGHGYTRRFGICYVDYPTQKRIPKSSALWLRDFIVGQRTT